VELTHDQITRAAVRRTSIWHRSGELSFDLRGGVSPLRPVALQVVVEELVGHACRYSPPGSGIEICTFADPNSWTLKVTMVGVDSASAPLDVNGELVPGVDVSFSLVRLAIEPVKGRLDVSAAEGLGRVAAIRVPV
jgi:hypothetical protein